MASNGDLDSWNPMKDDHLDEEFNKYDRGHGKNMPKRGPDRYGGVSLYVTGIPDEMTEEGLVNLFSKAGTCVEAKKMKSKMEGTGNTYGFVKMATVNECEKAIRKYHEFPIGDNKLRVKFSKTYEDRSRQQKQKQEEEEFLNSLSSNRKSQPRSKASSGSESDGSAHFMSRVKDVVRCDICSDPCREKFPAEVHCNTCHTNLCSPCVATHMTSDKSKKHDIVLFHSVDKEIILPTCSVHSNHKCDLICLECHGPICLKCLSTDHNSHKVQEMTELCRSLCKEIETETEELESHIIPEFEDIVKDEEDKLKKLLQDYVKLETSMEEHGEQVHKAVDAVIKKYKARVQQMKQDDAKAIGQQKDDINDLLSLAKQTAKRNKLIARSKNSTNIMNYKSENAKLRQIPALKNIIPSTFEAKDISYDLLEKFFGTIPKSRFLYKPGYTLKSNDGQTSAVSASDSTDKVTHSFALPYKLLYRVACSSRTKKLWTCGNENTVKCVDMRDGSILETLVFSLNAVSFCLTEMDILFVCDGVSILRREGTSDTRTYFSVPAGWIAEAITSTTCPVSGLLAVLRSEDSRQSKTVRIIDAQIRDEFQYDDKEKPLYHSGCYDYFLAENRNGDVCVSDTTALVVTDKMGRFRFKYHGNVFATFGKPFKPRGVATDKDGNILLSDLDNSCIHLVEENGKFIRYITCGRSLDKVCDLCIDGSGCIWIAERNSARVKCIRYH
ncbi:uncharacterized protein LOC134280319 [Saccostrea cucullata]|uniref:uncharacterized protein LOC134280319 n=1 Tax=Saccostrea cuccullata TaxID=36930 RepID=UPI002ED2E71B